MRHHAILDLQRGQCGMIYMASLPRSPAYPAERNTALSGSIPRESPHRRAWGCLAWRGEAERTGHREGLELFEEVLRERDRLQSLQD